MSSRRFTELVWGSGRVRMSRPRVLGELFVWLAALPPQPDPEGSLSVENNPQSVAEVVASSIVDTAETVDTRREIRASESVRDRKESPRHGLQSTYTNVKTAVLNGHVKSLRVALRVVSFQRANALPTGNVLG